MILYQRSKQVQEILLYFHLRLNKAMVYSIFQILCISTEGQDKSLKQDLLLILTTFLTMTCREIQSIFIRIFILSQFFSLDNYVLKVLLFQKIITKKTFVSIALLVHLIQLMVKTVLNVLLYVRIHNYFYLKVIGGILQ
ncbi:transmembrane protein, putative (macronuclear) [Tetrahymena thermophila SB210]|uniref:Transmembrane protein, putative n=1 Tax=Tetrahymena thermophila (strain SB210) TaxID=312017 RepID=W7X4A8_TETTS|nr:transmembrane protein, putative [Tetrahymena thermophila SB210]EWS74155.1 transmembrane protein, putative [Tetrahymena thermophila SB210]|eukprot:XP_012653315.1 transmembrane protein, putative [Tetrahymena thermophila SB210]